MAIHQVREAFGVRSWLDAKFQRQAIWTGEV
jgi:hypothetical protein